MEENAGIAVRLLVFHDRDGKFFGKKVF